MELRKIAGGLLDEMEKRAQTDSYGTKASDDYIESLNAKKSPYAKEIEKMIRG